MKRVLEKYQHVITYINVWDEMYKYINKSSNVSFGVAIAPTDWCRARKLPNRIYSQNAFIQKIYRELK